MDTPGKVIAALGGASVVSEAANVARNTVTYWATRKRIPSEYWDVLVALANERNIKEIDHALLTRICEPRKRRNEIVVQSRSAEAAD